MPFRKVDARFAGPAALGILVPMGTRTLVVVRPRSLPWDFVPSSWNAETQTIGFPVFSREAAAAAARRFQKALETALTRGESPVEVACDAAETCYQIRLRTQEFLWLACRREPGESFRPVVFAGRQEALAAAKRIEGVVFPSAERVQEYYFNTQNVASALQSQG